MKYRIIAKDYDFPFGSYRRQCLTPICTIRDLNIKDYIYIMRLTQIRTLKRKLKERGPSWGDGFNPDKVFIISI